MATIYFKFKSESDFQPLEFERSTVTVDQFKQRVCLLNHCRTEELHIFQEDTGKGLHSKHNNL